MLKKRTVALLSLLLAAAFGLQLALGLCAGSLERPDSAGYVAPAEELLRSGRYASGDGCERAPGFPVFLAGVRAVFGRSNAGFVFAAALISALGGAMVFASAKNFFPENDRIALFAAAFFLFDPTMLGNAPLLLSDALFAVMFAGVLWLFSRYCRNGKWQDAAAAFFLAGLGALTRPIGMFWFIPGAAAVIGTAWSKGSGGCGGETGRRALWHGVAVAAAGAAGFALVLTPWMLRNDRAGCGFCIDTNTGAMYHQNGAMLLAKVRGGSYEEEKQNLIREVADQNFASPGERSAYQKRRLAELVMAHPLDYAILHLKSQVYLLLPDVPALSELAGLTGGGRGTLEVLQKQGVFAAAKHYFGGKWGALFLFLPLLLWHGALLILAALALGCWVWGIRRNWLWVLLALAFAEYFLILPGPIAVPRYFLPALPFAALAAGRGAEFLARGLATWRSRARRNVAETEETGKE